MTPPPIPSYDLPPQRPPRGCMFYGCITAVVLALVLGVGGFFAVRHWMGKLVEVVLEKTETAPMELPKSDMPPAEFAQLEGRVREFMAAANARRQTEPLVLDSDDLNALIDRDPDWAPMRDRVHLTLVGDRIEAEISLPLGEFLEGIPGTSELKGRYLNGTATLSVSLVDSVLDVMVHDAQVKGEDLPPEVMAGLSSRNLVEDFQGDADIQKLKNWIESIEVAGGKLTIGARAGK